METFSLLLIVGTQGLYTRGWRKPSTLASPKSQLSSSPPVRSSRTAANRWRVRQSTIKSCFPWKTLATKPSKTTPLPIMEELNAPPTLDMLSCGKASGSNGIPPEIVKAGKENSLLGHLLGLLLQCWHERTLPQDMRDVEIITLYKKKRATTVIAKTIAECLSKHVGQGIRTGCPQPLPTTPWPSLLKVLVRISSEKVNNQYGFLLQAATREIPRTETLAVPHIHWLDQGIWPGQSYRTLPASAHDWMSPPPKTPEGDHVISSWHDVHRPIWRFILGPFPNQERREARMRPSTYTFRHLFLPTSALPLPWVRRWYLRPHQKQRQPVQPMASQSKDKGASSAYQGDALCRRCCPRHILPGSSSATHLMLHERMQSSPSPSAWSKPISWANMLTPPQQSPSINRSWKLLTNSPPLAPQSPTTCPLDAELNVRLGKASTIMAHLSSKVALWCYKA